MPNSTIPTQRQPVAWPVRVYLQPKHREELIDCEMGSWEDNSIRDGEHWVVDAEAYGSDVHPVPLLQEDRGSRNELVLNTPEEVDAICYAVASGTFQLYHYRVARRVFDLLFHHASEEYRNGLWAAGPSGR